MSKRIYIKKKFLCETCGEVRKEFFYGTRKTCCKPCHVKKTHTAQKENKKFAVAAKGGKCEYCGYAKCVNALVFHHTDPTKKDANYKTMSSWGKERITKELKNCILLCANCHAEEHEKLDKQKVANSSS